MRNQRRTHKVHFPIRMKWKVHWLVQSHSPELHHKGIKYECTCIVRMYVSSALAIPLRNTIFAFYSLLFWVSISKYIHIQHHTRSKTLQFPAVFQHTRVEGQLKAVIYLTL